MGQKDGDFLFLSTTEPMVTFLVLKNNTSPKEAFFRDSVLQVLILILIHKTVMQFHLIY